MESFRASQEITMSIFSKNSDIQSVEKAGFLITVRKRQIHVISLVSKIPLIYKNTISFNKYLSLLLYFLFHIFNSIRILSQSILIIISKIKTKLD